MRKLINATFAIAIFAGVVITLTAQTPAQKSRLAANGFKESSATQQPLYKDYKGVEIGMTAEEARAKLGPPALKSDDQDYYVFSEKETAQILYDKTNRVIGISIDYLGGVGAPDPKAVVGGELEMRNGSEYKLVRYQSLGFWVSYNRTVGAVGTVTITLQKLI